MPGARPFPAEAERLQSVHMAEVILTDDGVGIKDTYMEDSPWYSSLHKAKEILYMLCGKLDISGDVMSGTTVKFSFPIQQ